MIYWLATTPDLVTLFSSSAPIPFEVASMSQVLRFNSTDPRVTYGGQWAANWRQDGSSSSATAGAQFFMLFRGIYFLPSGFVVYFPFS